MMLKLTHPQAYILGPLLGSVVGGLIYEFIFDAHYGAAEKYTAVEETNGETTEMT